MNDLLRRAAALIKTAEWLTASGWASADSLGIYGGSNGGLLVGAAMTQRPDLFNAVVCVAPLLDLIRSTTSEPGPPRRSQESRATPGNPRGRPDERWPYFNWPSFCSIFASGIAPGTRSPSANT